MRKITYAMLVYIAAYVAGIVIGNHFGQFWRLPLFTAGLVAWIVIMSLENR